MPSESSKRAAEKIRKLKVVFPLSEADEPHIAAIIDSEFVTEQIDVSDAAFKRFQADKRIDIIIEKLQDCVGYPNPMVDTPCLLTRKAKAILVDFDSSLSAERDAVRDAIEAAGLAALRGEEYFKALSDLENGGRDRDAKRRRDQGLMFLINATKALRAALDKVKGVYGESKTG
jgi:hypothetical protein